MKKWNTPEIAALDLNATANGFWPLDREVCPLILGGAHDATGCNPPEEHGKGQEANTQDPEDPTNDLS